MSQPDEFPDDELLSEELRSHFHGLFERLMREQPELARFAEERAEALARALVELAGAGADNPAMPTLKSAVKKLVFCLTDPGDLEVTPTDEDIGGLLVEFYQECGGNLQITANSLDTYANYMPRYTNLAQAAAGESWGQMDASQRLQSTLEIAEQQFPKDFN